MVIPSSQTSLPHWHVAHYLHLLFSPLFTHITSMAKTSRSHPSSPPPRAKVTTRHRSPSARYKAGYASSPLCVLVREKKCQRSSCPSGQKCSCPYSCAKDPAVLPDEHAPVPPDLRKCPPENNFMTTVLMPVGTHASNGMLPNTTFQT